MSFHLRAGIARCEMGNAVRESMSLHNLSADAMSQCGLFGPDIAEVYVRGRPRVSKFRVGGSFGGYASSAAGSSLCGVTLRMRADIARRRRRL